MEMPGSLAVFLAVVVVALLAAPAAAGYSGGTATFYGGSDASGTMGGACGYGNLYTTGYGKSTAALSTVLFNGGASCGQCYNIMCDASSSSWCRQGSSVTITATNFCPPNYALSSNNGGWCNPPRPHFDMAQPAWLQIGASTQAGIIPVLYQRVACVKQGGVRFIITGFNYYELVLISNVGGSGSVASAWVKGTSTNRVPMTRNWGANWQSLAGIAGQALTLGVTSSGGQTIVFENVVPSGWSFGMSFISNLQFSY